ncbi:uncharacterized protein B0T23DRAFT_112833 [Neurospora hispaniola]|uniref:Secreted protein n=1 Tax=Neurospora hispaniola TaxID=588809 RepID=A0AAJ0I9R5_9PEZI|nr:hypothetical protein B0T23DRAFT_112833 [Neurospora hispaniola]
MERLESAVLSMLRFFFSFCLGDPLEWALVGKVWQEPSTLQADSDTGADRMTDPGLLCRTGATKQGYKLWMDCPWAVDW